MFSISFARKYTFHAFVFDEFVITVCFYQPWPNARYSNGSVMLEVTPERNLCSQVNLSCFFYSILFYSAISIFLFLCMQHHESNVGVGNTIKQCYYLIPKKITDLVHIGVLCLHRSQCMCGFNVNVIKVLR